MNTIRRAKLFMDTVVELKIVTPVPESAEVQMQRAFQAFRNVEDACSRFDPDSELRMLCARIGTPIRVSPYLFEPLRFSLTLAKETNGAFDPTVGGIMEQLSFDRHYLTGQSVRSHSSPDATYRDIELDEKERTVLLRKPMMIDLGAVAKGFAVDLAANVLKDYPGYLINAGGDLYAGGFDQTGADWQIGIQHPSLPDQVIETVELSNAAICTSGSYIRKQRSDPKAHHLVNPFTGRSANDWISCSVIAPFAMLADGFSTAVFVLGRAEGKTLIRNAGLTAIFITEDLTIEKEEAP